ncbi:MAG: hypothetical protein AAF845_12450 [Bacteroidota bacterium]
MPGLVRSLRYSVWLLGLMPLLVSAQREPSFTILTDGTPFAGVRNTLHSISANGLTVTGTLSTVDSNGRFLALRTYAWTADGGFQLLPFLADESGASALRDDIPVNQDGTRVAAWVFTNEDTRNEDQRLLVWTPGGDRMELTPPRGRFNGFSSLGMSGDGTVVVGRIGEEGPLDQNVPDLPVRWDNSVGTVLPLGTFDEASAVAISANGQTVVGFAKNDDGTAGGGPRQAVRWTEAGIETLVPQDPSIVESEARAVSNTGHIAIQIRKEIDGRRFLVGAIWGPDDTYIELPEGGSLIKAISANGAVVAGSRGLWTQETGWRDVRSLLEGAGLSDDIASLTSMGIEDMSASGRTIAGPFRRPGGPVDDGYIAYLGPADDDIIITVTGDEADADDGAGRCDVDTAEAGDQCTLRAAIQTANIRTGRDSISVDIEGGGPHTITLTSALPALTEPLVLDATTQPGYTGTPRLEVVGTGVAEGFVLSQGESTLRGLALGRFTGAAVRITGPGENRLEANHIGLDASGTAARPNGIGVFIDASPDNQIGGAAPGAEIDGANALRNVISGNAVREGDDDSGIGVLVRGAAATGNVIAGNYIGTTATGTAALGNGQHGVSIDNAPENVLGGDTASLGNVISGSAEFNVLIDGRAAGENRIVGNRIGTSASGLVALSGSTDAGIIVTFASETEIGGSTATPGNAPGNLISGHEGTAVQVLGAPAGDGLPADAAIARGTVVAGNLIGTDATGAAALPNGGSGVLAYFRADETQVGRAGGANVISGNTGIGVLLGGPIDGDGPYGTVVAANLIGVNRAGTAALGNSGGGILLAEFDPPDPEEEDGARLGARGPLPEAVLPEGILPAGILPEAVVSEAALSAARRTTEPVVLGGGSRALGNVVAGNVIADATLRTRTGQITVVAPWAVGTRILGNRVGVLANGEAGQATGDSPYGVIVGEEAVGVGAPATAEGEVAEGPFFGNVIGGNRVGVGVLAPNVVVAANDIGVTDGTARAVPNEVGVWVLSSGTTVGTAAAAGYANVISGNTRYGVLVGQWEDFVVDSQIPPLTRGARIIGNAIGTNRGRTRGVGNGLAGGDGAGVFVADGGDHRIALNTISSNRTGIDLRNRAFGADGDPQTIITANLIGLGGVRLNTDDNGQILDPRVLGNAKNGIRVASASEARIVALELDEADGERIGNWIWGNGEAGVRIEGADGTILAGNVISDNRGLGVDIDDAGVGGGLTPPTVFLPTIPDGQDDPRVFVRSAVGGTLVVTFSPSCDASGFGEGRFLGAARTVAAGETVELAVPLGASEAEAEGFPGLFLSEAAGFYVTARTVTEAASSEFSRCVRVGDSNAAFWDLVDGDLEAILGIAELGLDLATESTGGAVTDPQARLGGGGAARVYGVRHDRFPDTQAVEGQAVAGDGTLVTPTNIAGRTWTLTAADVGAITYTACLDVDGVEGADVPGQLLVVRRDGPSQGWTALPTTLTDGRICASGLTAFGDLGIGADSLANPVSADPLPPEAPQALALGAPYPNPARAAMTMPVALPEAADLRLGVYDALGREVAVVYAGRRPAGVHAFRLDAARLPAGAYVARLAVGTEVHVRRLTVVR